MKYFIDTEFHEGFYKPLFGKKRHFVDLISIGIVSENGDEYYAVSKDFDIAAAWNSWQPKKGSKEKEYWLRDNVLLPIYTENISGDGRNIHDFSLSTMKWLIKSIGKTKKQIAEEIKSFVYPSIEECSEAAGVGSVDDGLKAILAQKPISFYGYYADYDWVLLCSLYGRMMDLPYGFPMFCYDLKQSMNAKMYSMESYWDYVSTLKELGKPYSEKDCIEIFIKSESFPVSKTEHNALSDAWFNCSLYEYLESF